MAVELHIYDGAQYRQADEVHMYDGSQYRDCYEVHIYDGAAWRKVFEKWAVTLSGEDVSHIANPGKAGIRINSDGTIDKREGDVYTQVDSGTDWIIPNGEASSAFDVRITNVSWTFGSSFNAAAAADDTWIDLGSNREWRVEVPTPNEKLVTFDLQIRYNSETVASTSYSLNADIGV